METIIIREVRGIKINNAEKIEIEHQAQALRLKIKGSNTFTNSIDLHLYQNEHNGGAAKRRMQFEGRFSIAINKRQYNPSNKEIFDLWSCN